MVDGSPVAEGAALGRSPAANTLVSFSPEHLQAYGARDLLRGWRLRGQRSNLVTFARPKHLELLDPGFQTALMQLGEGVFRVTLTAPHPALWAWLEVEGVRARYSDNFVHVFPGKPVEVVVKAEGLTMEGLGEKLRVRSLVDTYSTGCG